MHTEDAGTLETRMYQTDELLFVFMPKTASSKLERMAERFLGGRRVSHKFERRAIDSDRLASFAEGRKVFGSIRDPWDWYVSMWVFGCGEGGWVYPRVTERRYSLLQRRPLRGNLAQWRKPVELWRSLYADVHNTMLFRKWVKTILDPNRQADLGEHYCDYASSRWVGLLTHRYLVRYTLDCTPAKLNRRVSSFEDIVRWDAEHCFLDGVIRQEALGESFVAAVREAGRDISTELEQEMLTDAGSKHNATRRKKTSDYYDPETAALVGQKERLLIQKYGYSPPLALEVGA